MAGRRVSLVRALEGRQQESKILDLLARQDEGMTRIQISMMLGQSARSDVLLKLKARNIIKQRRMLLKNGQIAMVYTLKNQKILVK